MSLRRVSFYTAISALSLLAIIFVFLPGLVFAQTTPTTIVTVSAAGVTEGTAKDQASHGNKLTFTIHVNRPATSTKKPVANFFVDWNIDRDWHSDRNHRSGAATLTGPVVPNYVHEHGDVADPVVTTSSSVISKQDSSACDDGFCGRFRVYYFAETKDAQSWTATIDMKTISDRFQEVDESVRVNFTLKRDFAPLTGVELKDAPRGASHSRQVEATIADDDHELPRITVIPISADGRDGRGREGDSGDGSDLGAMLIFFRPDAECLTRTIAEVDWRVTETSTASSSGPFRDFTGPTSGTIRFDMEPGNPDGPGETRCAQTKRIVLKTVPDLWAEGNEEVTLSFSVRDSFPGALLLTTIVPRTPADAPRRNAIVKPYIADDDPEAGVVTITPSVPKGSSLVEGTSHDKTSGAQVDFTVTVHRPPPAAEETAVNTNWTVGWRFPLTENQDVDLKGHSEHRSVPIAEETRDIWAREPQVTKPPIRQYNQMTLTLGFPLNSGKAERTLTMEVNPDDLVEGAETATLRFSPGSGLIDGKSLSLPGGAAHADFSYTIANDDVPPGRVFVDAPAEGTVVTEGSKTANAGEIRLTLTAHRSLAEAAQARQTIRKFRYTIDSTSTATAGADFTVGGRRGATGDITLNFQRGKTSVEQDLVIAISPDQIHESRESIVLKLNALDGSFPDGDDADSDPDKTVTFTYHIEDDDLLDWQVTATAPRTVSEGTGTGASDGNTAQIMVAAYRSQAESAVGRSYSFRWEVVREESAATTGGDLKDHALAASGTLPVTFGPGHIRSRETALDLTTIPDFAFEPDEKLVIRLRTPRGDANFRFLNGKKAMTVELTIVDDDESTGTIEVTAPEVGEASGTPLTFRVRGTRKITTERRLDVGTVTWQLLDDTSTATRGTDFTTTARSGSLNLSFPNRNANSTPARTFSMTVTDDELPEGNETVAVRLRKGNDGFHFPDADGDGYPDRELIVLGRIVDNEEGTTTVTIKPSSYNGEGNDITFTVTTTKQPMGERGAYTNPRSTGVLHWELIPETAAFSPTDVDAGYKPGEDFKFRSVSSETATQDSGRPANDRPTYTRVITNGRLTGKMDLVMPAGDILETHEIKFATHVDGLVEQAERFTVRFWLDDADIGDLTFPEEDAGERSEILVSAELHSKEQVDVNVPSALSVIEGKDVVVELSLARQLKAGESATLTFNAMRGGVGGSCGSEMARQDLDYVPVHSRTLTWRGGEQTKRIAITTIGDALDDADKCFQIVWVAGAGGLKVKGSRVHSGSGGSLYYTNVTIEDDDDPPVLYAKDASVVEADEGELPNLRFEIGLNTPTNRKVQVSYALDTSNTTRPNPEFPDAATAGADFVSSTAADTVTFEPGEVRKYVDVQVRGDYTEEENEWLRLKFTVMGEAAVTFGGASEIVVVGFIRDDDDELELSITLDDPRVQEGEAAVYRLHLSRPITRSLDVQVVASDESAKAGSDYASGGWTFSVPEGETEATIAIPTTEDGVSGEGTEKFSVSVSNIRLGMLVRHAAGPKEYRELFGSDYALAALSASIKAPSVEVLDGPSVSIVPVYPEGQVEGMPQLFEARLNEPVGRDITVTIKSADPLFDPAPDFQPGLGYRVLTHEYAASSQPSDRDYTALPDAGTAMIIPAGDTSSPRFSVATVDDGIDEWAERFIVYITDSSGMQIDENLAVGIIRDNDARPTLSISDATTVTEGGNLSFEVTLSAPSQKNVTVQWHTEDGSAIAAEGDYEAASQQPFTFQRSASNVDSVSKQTARITVKTLNDEAKEGPETLRVVLSQAPEAKSGTLSATGQILDDDDQATVTIEDAAPVAEASGAAAQFTVRLRRPQLVPVTVQWSTVEAVGSGFETAQTGGEPTWGEDDFTPTSNASLTFSPGETVKTISVGIKEDIRGEGTEYFLVKLTGDPAKVRFERDTARGYIEDPNALRIWLSDETLRYIRDGIPEGSGGKTGDRYTTTVDTPLTLTLHRTPIPQDADGYHEGIRTLSCFREMATDGRSATLHPEDITAVYAGAFDIAGTNAADVLFQARRFEANRSLQCQTRYEVLWPLYQNWDSGVWELAIPLAIPQDTRKEKDESFTVQVEFFSAPWTLRRTAYPDFVNFAVTFTIVDDDSNKVSLDFAPGYAPDGKDEDGLNYKTVPEGADAMLRVSTSEPVPTLQTVSIITRTGTAEPGVDFAYAGASEVIIPAGKSYVDVPISVLDDIVYEGAESFVLELVNESDGIAIHTPQDAVRVKIPEDRPTLYVVPDVTVDEGDAATLTFRFDQPLRTETTVRWIAVSPGVPNQAAAGTHYVAPAPGGDTMTIPAGEISKSITISTLDNGRADGDWVLGVVAVADARGKLDTQYFHPGYELHVSRVTIRDTGTRSVAFSETPGDVSRPEGFAYDLPQPEVSVQPSDKPVFFSLAGADAEHFDIHPITGVITVPALHHTKPKDAGTDNTYDLQLKVTDEDGNQDSARISVTVEERPLHIEPATIAIAEKVVTTDGDTTTEAPGSAVLTVYPAAGSIREGEEVVITLSAKEGAPAYTLQRTKGNPGDPQDDGADATTELTYTFANRNAKHEVTVTAVDDEIANDPPKREGVIVITVKGGGYLETQQFEVPVSVTDDDQKGILITPTELTLVEKEDVEYTVVLTSEPTGPVSVKLTGIPNTGIRTGTGRDAQGVLNPLPANDTLTFTTKNWNEPQTVLLHKEHNRNEQFDSEFTIKHEVTGGGYGSVGAEDVAVAVVNIDAALDLIRLRKVDEGDELEIHFVFQNHPNGAPRDYTLTWSTADDTMEGANQAVAGVDYTAVTDQVLTIKKGEGVPESDLLAEVFVEADPIVLKVQTTQDLVDEDDETFSFTFKPSEGLVAPGDGVYRGKIVDDDEAPTVSVGDATAVAEGNDPKTATDMTFTVTLSAASSREITVDYTLGGTATAGEDYTDPATKTVTIAAGEATGSIVIPVLGDVVDEPNETITVALSNPTNATLSTTAGDTEASGTITDDDDGPAVTIADASAVTEGNDPNTATDMTFAVTLAAASEQDATIEYTLGGTATAGEDYTDPETKSITIAKGETEGSIVIAVLGDVVDEAAETIVVTLTSPTNATLGSPAEATGTITDDDDAPTVSVSDALPVTEGNDPNTTTDMTFTVTLAAASGQDATIEYTLGGTATDSTTATALPEEDSETAEQDADSDKPRPVADYTDPETKSVTIAAGSLTGSIVIPVLGDVVDEDDETIIVTLTNPTNATLSSTAGETEATGTITDDDASPTVTIADASAVPEGDDPSTATDMTFAVTLSAASERATSVSYTLGGTATAGSDYIDPAPKTIEIEAGETERKIEVPVLGDLVHDPGETIIVTLIDPTNATLGTPKTATGTITDDDTAPTTATLSVSPSIVAEGAAATTVTVTATLAGSVTFNADTAVTVKVGEDGDTAVSSTDYAGVSDFSITITAGQSSGQGTFSLAPMQDTLDEDDEKLTVHATATGLTIADAEVTITDDDALPTVTIADASVAEGEKAEFTVTLGAVSGRDVTVQWTTGDDGAEGANQATADKDYTAQTTAQTLTIDAGSATGTIEVQTTEDSVAESEETFTVTLASPTNATIGTSTATGTITDDDTAPTTASLSVSPSSVGEEDSATTVTVTATLAGSVTFNADTTVTVKVGKSGDTAISGTDYTGVSGFNITITAGQKSGQGTFSLAPRQDTLDEDDEKLTVHATATNLTIADAEVTITDDDALPTVTIADAKEVMEGDDPSTATNMTFAVTLSAASGRDVSVDYTLGGTATAGSDYTDPETKTITIAAGSATGSVSIPVLGDELDEPNETVTVALASPTNATLGSSSTASGTITDDDERGVTLTNPAGVAVPAGGLTVHEVDKDATADVAENVATYEVSLASKPTGTVTITVTSADTTVATVSAQTLTFTPSDWDAQTVTVTAVDDDVDNAGDQRKTSITHTVSSRGNDYEDESVGSVAVTVTDDEATPTATLSLSSATINESGNGNASTVTATLSGKSDRAVTIEVSVPNGSPVTLSANRTLTIAAGATTSTGTVTLTAVDNDVDAPNATVSVSGAASGGGVSDPSAVTLTITDDEGTPTATLVLTPSTIDESGAKNESTVTARLSVASSEQVTVEVSAPGGSPVTLSANKTLTIAAGATTSTGTVTLTAVDNDVDAPNAMVTVSGTTSGGGVTNPQAVTLTITDDEGTPTVTLVLTPSTINESGATNESTVTARLSGKSDSAVTIEVSVPNGSPVTLSANKTLMIAAGATTSTGAVTLTAVDNDVDAPNATVTVSGTASGGGVANPSPVTLTITDDDTAPTTASLSVSPSSVGEEDSATTVTVTATLAGSVTFDADKTVTVTVGKSGDTAISGTDYTGVSGFNITITASQKSGQGTFSLAPRQDTLDEDDEKLTVHATASGLTISDAEVSITDDDALPELTIADASVAEGGKAEFAVTLDAASGRDVTVQWTTGDDGADGANQATADTDYTAQSSAATLTIKAGSRSGTIEVQTTEDTLAEGAETFTVTLASPTNATLGTPKTATGTITDDDTAPTTATLLVSPSSVGEEDSATTVTVTATLAGSVTFNADTTVTVKVGKDGDAAESGTDYTGVGDFSITIAAGELSGEKTFSLAPRQDTLDEDDEKLTVHATAPDLTISDAEVTITDDDALPELTIADASVVEGEKAEFAVTLDAVSGRDVTVQWTTGDDGADGANQATADTDYTAQSSAATLTIKAGSRSGTIEVQTTEDTIAEGAETFTVTLASPTNATLGTSTATGTITDDDTAPTTASLSVSPSSVGEEDSATTVTVTATLAGSTTFAANKTVTVKVGKDGDAAVSGTDYTAVSDVTLTITAGQKSGQGTFSLAPRQDTLDEDDEKLTVHATASGLTIADAEVTITDDDALPELTIEDASVAEGEKAQFAVTLDAVSGRDVTVQWTTGDDGADGAKQATADTDYTAQSSAATLTIKAGSRSGTIEVQTTEDRIAEGAETFTVTLASPTNATIGTSTATGTITDDDTAPTTASLSVSPSSVAEGAGATTVTVTATLAGSVTFNADTTVAVTVGKSGDTAISGTDYTGVSGFNITITAGQKSGQGTFSLAPRQDTLDEDDEKLTVHATASGLTIADAEVTITDDDALPELTIADASVAEGEKAQFAVTLDAASGRDVTVQWTTGDDGADGANQATADTDYTAQTTAQTLTIDAGSATGTIEVQTTEDSVAESEETFTVTLASPTNATLGSSSTATGTITDDDTAPTTATLSVSPSSVAEGAAATTVTVTATLAGSVTFNADTTVTVKVGKDGDAAESGTDYAAVSDVTLTITAGESSGKQTFSLAPRQDTLDEDDEKLTVHATATNLTIADAEVTITDDDALPTVTIADAKEVMEGDDPSTATNMTFAVTLSAASGRDVSVDYTLGGTATAGSDYTDPETKTITIAAGSATGSVSIPVLGDELDEPNETVTVALASPTNATLGSSSTASGTITDDDERGVTLTNPAGVAVPAGGLTVHEVDKTTTEDVTENVATYEVSLASKPTGTVTITVASADTTVATVSPNTLTFTPSEWDAQTITVTAVDDDVDNTGDQRKTSITHTVSSRGNDYEDESVGSVAVTVTDDEATPVATLSLSSATINESGNGNASTVTGTLSGKSDRAVTIDVSVPNGSPVTLGANKTLTIAAGTTTSTGTVTLTAVDNDVDAPNATVSVSGAASGGGVSDPSAVTLTITDDEGTPTATLVLAPSTIDESGATNESTVTARLSVASSEQVTVEVSAPGGSPVTLSANKTLTIAAGATTSTGTVTLTAVDNDVDAPNATVSVSGAASGGGVANPSPVTLTITDDEGTPTATLVLTPSTINESGATNESTVTARLSGESSEQVTVEVSVPAQSLVTLSANKTLTIAAGSTTSAGAVTLTAVDNDVDAPNATVTVSGAASGGGVTNPSPVTLTITDDDTAPTTASLSVSPSSVAEGAGATTVTVTATLAGSVTFDADKTVTAKVGKDGDTAISGTDYTAVSDVTLTITAGQKSGQGTFSLAPRQDTLDEDDEKLTVHATASGLTISDAEVTITDDDAEPELTIADASVAEGGKAQFPVTLDAVSGRDVTVQWTTGDDGAEGAKQATADTDYTAQTTAQTLTIAAGSATGTIEVQTTEDTIAEDAETFTVTLASPTNATLGTTKTATGTITDDDTAPTTATLLVSPSSVGEEDSATTVTVTATLAGSVTFNADTTVTVKVGKDGDAAESGTDYTASATSASRSPRVS